jgi:hypothetical protein
MTQKNINDLVFQVQQNLLSLEQLEMGLQSIEDISILKRLSIENYEYTKICLAILNRLIQIDSQDIDSISLMAGIYWSLGEEEICLYWVREGQSIDANNLKLMELEALSTDDISKAISIFKKIIAIDPEYTYALRNLRSLEQEIS